MSDKQRAARDAGQWGKGTMVLLRGLSVWKELNGRSGVVSDWEDARGRYNVRLANRVVRAKPQQLDMHPLQVVADGG